MEATDSELNKFKSKVEKIIPENFVSYPDIQNLIPYQENTKHKDPQTKKTVVIVGPAQELRKLADITGGTLTYIGRLTLVPSLHSQSESK